MNPRQISALMGAYRGLNDHELEKLGRSWWDSDNDEHHPATIRSLVNRQFLRLRFDGTIATITDSGVAALKRSEAKA